MAGPRPLPLSPLPFTTRPYQQHTPPLRYHAPQPTTWPLGGPCGSWLPQVLEEQLASAAAERSALVRMRTELERAANKLEAERLAWEKGKVRGCCGRRRGGCKYARARGSMRWQT